MKILSPTLGWCLLGTMASLTAGCGEGELRDTGPILATTAVSEAPARVKLDEGSEFDSRVAQGQNLLASEHFDEAKQVFGSALEVDPGNTDALLGLADSERNLGELPQAQRHFEEVLGLSAERDELLSALSGLAVVHRAMGNTQAAEDLSAEAEALRGTDAIPR